MRKLPYLALLALFVFGWEMTASADPGQPLPPPGSTSALNHWIHGDKDPPKPTRKPDKKPEAKKPEKKPAEDPVAVIRAQEHANCMRRLAVCVQLMEVAEQTNDEELRRKADELNQRAWDAYTRRMEELNAAAPPAKSQPADAKPQPEPASKGGLSQLFPSFGGSKDQAAQAKEEKQ